MSMPENGAAPGVQPQITPQPIPTEMGVRIAEMSNGTHQVQLLCNTNLGVFNFFMPPEMAEDIGKGLVTAAGQARTGLTIAKSLPQQKGQG